MFILINLESVKWKLKFLSDFINKWRYLPNCICMKCDNQEGLKPDFAVPKVGHMHGVTNLGVLNDGICVEKRRLCQENGQQILDQPSSYKSLEYSFGCSLEWILNNTSFLVL